MMEGSFTPSSLSTPTPASSSSSATPRLFKPRKSEDWNKYRPFIEQLYRNDQLKLKDVKNIMERDHNFTASSVLPSLVSCPSPLLPSLACLLPHNYIRLALPGSSFLINCSPISQMLRSCLTFGREKQYKDRLSSWNIRKNIKAKEVRIMYRKQQKRAAIGKQTVFRVAGQKVDTKRIARFVRRYGTNIDNESRPVEPSGDSGASPEPCMSSRWLVPFSVVVNCGAATPSDMSYYTPEPDERPTSLSLSPHPESDAHPCETADSASAGTRVAVNQNKHTDDSLDPTPDSDQHDGRPPSTNPAYQLYDADGKPLKPIPPIANDPQGAYTMYNRYIVALGARLDRETAPFRSVVDESSQQY
ncbi:Clr5 domain-containing protein [Aspergillus spinulosporus]